MQSATLIYDGECPLCQRARDWILPRALPGALALLACQSEERRAQFDFMPEHECLEAMQIVLPDGTVYAGDRALPHVLRRLRRWQWLAYLFRLPGVSLLAPVVYRAIARHRYALGTLVTRKGDGAEACDIDPPNAS
jgi:predicted DCC family thiol-disulfide oxidoreductase YuxK